MRQDEPRLAARRSTGPAGGSIPPAVRNNRMLNEEPEAGTTLRAPTPARGGVSEKSEVAPMQRLLQSHNQATKARGGCKSAATGMRRLR